MRSLDDQVCVAYVCAVLGVVLIEIVQYGNVLYVLYLLLKVKYFPKPTTQYLVSRTVRVDTRPCVWPGWSNELMS